MADSDQRREFLEEIQLMKALGSHKNIVNMVGCCTLEEPMFLLVEFVPYGDLLHYLRKRRGKVHRYKKNYVKATSIGNKLLKPNCLVWTNKTIAWSALRLRDLSSKKLKFTMVLLCP